MIRARVEKEAQTRREEEALRVALTRTASGAERFEMVAKEAVKKSDGTEGMKRMFTRRGVDA